MSDQGGLCAYCEIDLIDVPVGTGSADFRVEHFHPKNDSNISKNWHLEWNNLFACCHGGSERNVVNSSLRFTSPDVSCDVPKGSKILDGTILNPLSIPKFPNLFDFDRSTGSIKANITAAASSGLPVSKLQSTIDELNLDAPRLRKFRRTTLGQINRSLQVQLNKGLSINQAKTKLAQAYLRKDSKGNWPAFFSAIRSYLGSEAEDHLKNINYLG